MTPLQLSNEQIDRHLGRALDLATHAAQEGGGPFGAVLVTSSGREFEGSNRVTSDNDPTAHAEIVAIRRAAALEGFDLSGAVLYSSCQPCPMCLTAALWARVEIIVYGATQEDAALAGFDDSTFYDQLRSGLYSVTDAHIMERDHPRAVEPFEAWAANEGRIEY